MSAVLTNDRVKELALANGFKLKEQSDGSMDLNPYVYEFAQALAQELKGDAVEVNELVYGNSVTYPIDSPLGKVVINSQITQLVNAPETIGLVIPVPRGLHSETMTTIRSTAEALGQKLYRAQIKHGLVDGWKNPPADMTGNGTFFLTEEELQKAFLVHINKNDPLDVIAYCAFARELGFNLPAVRED